MKRTTRLFGIAVLVTAMLFAASSCGNPASPGGGDPTVTGVTVTPNPATAAPGTGRQFTASVKGTNNPGQTVEWSIETSGVHTDTKIDDDGLLTVAAGETQTSLTVRATSTVDTGKYGDAAVTIGIPVRRTVTFNADGGSPAPETATVNDGEKVTKPADMTRSGYTFDGWYKEAGFDNRWNFDVDIVDNDITLYAKWNEEGSGTPTVTSVTVSPASQTVEKGGNQQFSASVEGTNNPAQTVTWSIETSGVHTDTKIVNGLLTVAAAETQTSLTVRATSTVNTTKYGEAIVTVKATNQRTEDDDEDFGVGKPITRVFDIDITEEWNAALDTIAHGGDNKNYVMNINADIEITQYQPLAQDYNDSTFGRGLIIVSIRGNHKVSLSSNGRAINLWDSDQTVIIRDVDFVGRENNSSPLIDVGHGKLTLKGSATISGNDNPSDSLTNRGGGVDVGTGTLTMEDNSQIFGNKARHGGGVLALSLANEKGTVIMKDDAQIYENEARYGGGGVYVSNATLIMEGNARIFRNKSTNWAGSGGGVSVPSAGTFVMRDNASISGNSSEGNGGGVSVGMDSSFQISGGTVFGNDGSAEDSNTCGTSNSSAALYVSSGIIAQYGTFSGDTFTSNGDLATTSETIKVVNGVLQQ